MSAIIISYFFAEKFAREIIWIWLLNLGRIKVICIIFSVHCRQLLSHIQLLATPWATVHQVSLSCTISQTLLKFMCVELMVPSNHLILCHPLLLPSVFPSIRVFPSKSALWIRWSKYWSFSISPSNEYSGLISFGIDWLIFFLSKGLSRVFSSTTVQKHLFFSTKPFLWSNSHICAWPLEKP